MRKTIFLLLFWLSIFLHAENGLPFGSGEADSPFCSRLIDIKKSEFFASLFNPSETGHFYNSRCLEGNQLSWFDPALNLNAQGYQLFQGIESAYAFGLDPDKYHRTAASELLRTIRSGGFADPAEKFDAIRHLDILLTDAYMTLAKDLYYGMSDWNRLVSLKEARGEKFEWDRSEKPPFSLPEYLALNLERNTTADSLIRLSPENPEYARLLKLLRHYRKLKAQGGWETIPPGETIRIGNRDERIALIQKRLSVTGELPETDDLNTTLYNDTNLINAVKLFQERHNLLPDGIIGKKTLAALNIPINAKIRSIILNLERLRWIDPRSDKYPASIRVNIPAFELSVLEYGEELFTMKAIVGKKERPTPILESKLSYAVLNPSWTAPETIIREDILGKNDIDEYLDSHDMRVYVSRRGRLVEIYPGAVNWKKYAGKKHIPFIFKAAPGDANPLGNIKFIFPNKYSVYMHDTNTRTLFDKDYRAISSGCVRISDPQRLLNYLTESEEESSDGNETVNGEYDKIVNLKKRIPVLFRYMTVRVDENLNGYFYDDIYGYDELLLTSLGPIDWMEK